MVKFIGNTLLRAALAGAPGLLRAQILPDTVAAHRPPLQELSVRLGSGIFTTGTDGPAVVLQAGYQYRLRPHLSLGAEVGMAHGWANGQDRNVYRYPNSTAVYGPNTPNPALVQLGGHATSQTLIFLDPAVTLDLWYRPRQRLSVSLGPGLAFVNREFIEYTETGTFNGDLSGPNNIVLQVPYYESYLAGAGHVRFTYGYRLTSRVGLGLQAGTHYNFGSGDMLHLAALSLSVGF